MLFFISSPFSVFVRDVRSEVVHKMLHHHDVVTISTTEHTHKHTNTCAQTIYTNTIVIYRKWYISPNFKSYHFRFNQSFWIRRVHNIQTRQRKYNIQYYILVEILFMCGNIIHQAIHVYGSASYIFRSWFLLYFLHIYYQHSILIIMVRKSVWAAGPSNHT